MELFTLTDACTGCGLCAKACPASLVRQTEAGAPPVPLSGREAHCILCGHCVIACPTGAFVHALLPSQDFEPLRRGTVPDLATVRRLLMARRSCRLYNPKPIPRQDILNAIEAVRHAPTGHNARSVGYVVVDGPERMALVRQGVLDWVHHEVAAKSPLAAELHLAGAARAASRGRDVIFRDAPHAVVVHAPAEGVTPQTDAVIAASWLDIAATAAGLGTCWCGYLMFALAAHPPLGVLLGLPEGNRGYAALLLGRPAVRPMSIPPRPMQAVSFF